METEADVVRIKDAVAYTSGRVSHAVRHGFPDEEILLRRRQLSGAQIGREIRKTIAKGAPPTLEQVEALYVLMKTAALNV